MTLTSEGSDHFPQRGIFGDELVEFSFPFSISVLGERFLHLANQSASRETVHLRAAGRVPLALLPSPGSIPLGDELSDLVW